VSGVQFFNTSRLDFGRLLDSPDDLAGNLQTTSPVSPAVLGT